MPDRISALRQLTSLEYWTSTCPPPQMSCLRALESLAVDCWGVEDSWIEGTACLPSLKQLRYSDCVRLPSEFYALQLTSLKLDFSDTADRDAVLIEQVCAPAFSTCSLASPAESQKLCRSAKSWGRT